MPRARLVRPERNMVICILSYAAVSLKPQPCARWKLSNRVAESSADKIKRAGACAVLHVSLDLIVAICPGVHVAVLLLE